MRRDSPDETLQALGPALLALLTGDRAIALNRAAAADASGSLGAALTEAGRDTIAPLIARVFERARADGLIAEPDIQIAVTLYLDLLIGDLQIRRSIGAVPALSTAQRTARAHLALSRAMTLLNAPQSKS